MHTLGILTIAVGLLSVTVAACSSADAPEGSIAEAPVNKKKSAPAGSNNDNTSDNTPTPTPTPTPAPTPVDLTKDGIKNADETDIDCGGAKAAGCNDERACKANSDCKNNNCKSGTCKPAATPTHYCADLGACCNSLASTVEKIACLGIQFAGKEIACQGEAALCGIGGIGGTPCSKLDKCCDQWDADGYDSTECRSHNTGNASVCTTYLNQYKNLGYCN